MSRRLQVLVRELARWGSLMVLAGCADVGGVCLQAEIESGLVVELRDAMGPGEQPRAGMYQFTLTTEFGAVAWACEVGADDATARGCASDHSLAGGDDTALLVSAVAGEDGFRLVLTRLESNVWTGPEELRVEIERDGALVADERYMPEYEYSPLSGGRGCPQYWVLAGARPTIGLDSD